MGNTKHLRHFEYCTYVVHIMFFCKHQIFHYIKNINARVRVNHCFQTVKIPRGCASKATAERGVEHGGGMR